MTLPLAVYSLGDQSWCLTLGPHSLSHHSLAPCISEMPVVTSKRSSIGTQVSPEPSGSATATGAERSGLGAHNVGGVCVCVWGYVVKVVSRTEAASCTWSKVSPPPPPQGCVRDSKACAGVTLHSLLPYKFFFCLDSSGSLVGLGVPRLSYPLRKCPN